MSARIVIIGGGSGNWTARLATDLMLTEELGGSTLVLEDIDPHNLNLAGAVCKKIAEKSGTGWKVETTTSQLEALQGADFVILTISVGGDKMWANDVNIPMKYGIYQTVGDTVGPGGLSRALRHIPVVIDLARNMEKVCPDAWLINYTNPMTTITRAVNKVTSIKIIGLCHELLYFMDWLKEIFNVRDGEDIRVVVAGINHFIWILKMNIHRKDGFELLRDFIATNGIYHEVTEEPTYYLHAVQMFLFDKLGYLPAAGDRHIAEFFPYFLAKEAGIGKKFGMKLEQPEIQDPSFRASLLQEVEKMVSGTKPLPEGHSKEKSANIIAALVSGKDEEHIVNLPNKGQIMNLPRESVVESMAIVGANGVRPIAVGNVPAQIQQFLYPHILRQEMIVDASLEANRKLALQSLLSDSLVRNYDTAEEMLDELLKANSEALPNWSI